MYIFYNKFIYFLLQMEIN